MRFDSLRLAAVALLLTGLSAGKALACACCASEAERFEGSRPLETYEKEELGKIRLAAGARLSLNEAGFDAVKGIVRPAEEYKVTLEKTQAQWIFTFTDAGGRSGRLAIPSPRSARLFEIDPRVSSVRNEKPPAQVATVWLYKEWRFEHPLDAAGFFSSASDARITLILHGTGNHCFSADDFSHWTLLAKGRNTRYTLYGELVPSSAKE
ncbi:MAG: hypothetical protein F9K44_08810 [Hyphomicrobiaceae bacterium]|nr:MAG: hypothetical protein F9K44_08810 [Hyphomicrobiaceae bacterium]